MLVVPFHAPGIFCFCLLLLGCPPSKRIRTDGESEAWRTPVQTDTHAREQQTGHVRAPIGCVLDLQASCTRTHDAEKN
jgi:hypothetical protein